MNQVSLIGNLVRSPELRQVEAEDGGFAVCELRLAVDGAGARRGEAGFFEVTVSGKQAEGCAEHLQKGSRVAISGALRMREWGKGAERRSEVSIRAYRVDFLELPRAGTWPDGLLAGPRAHAL